MKAKEQTFHVVRETQVNTPQSLLTMTPGSTLSIQCADFVPYSTVKSAICRLNQKLERIEFESSSPDNGATIIIKRNKQ